MPSVVRPKTDESRASDKPVVARRSILLVDDDHGVRLLARDILEGLGYHVLEAAGSGEALRLWQDNASHIRLLLTDFAMPGSMNGRHLAEHLLARCPDLKIIMMSGHGSAVVRGSAFEKYFLPKPFVIESLAKIVQDCFAEV